uniref:Uncharacterized protein n=1 Tax=Anguilla anguilla TaxID=7936 RepID=A0A0E9UHF4_ANGAN
MFPHNYTVYVIFFCFENLTIQFEVFISV